MEFRNETFNADGGIKMEVEHPSYGWIPFTATSDDVEQLGRDLFAAAEATAAPYVPVTPEPQYKYQFTSLEYLERFPAGVEDAVIEAAKTNVQLQKFYNHLLAATYIDVRDQRTIGGCALLVQIGFLTQAQSDVILEPELI